MNNKLVLAIDTSCDDSSAAVVKGCEVWSNVIASQTQLHKPYGGVFPTVAKQAHKENLPRAVELALTRAGVTWPEIEAIVVTQGPGLAPALEVGIKYAREIAEKHHLPLIPANHLEGHLLSVLAYAKPKTATKPKLQPSFPALGMVISGGHSLFVLVKEVGNYTVLGSTIDDAAGEALDKIGRMLGLGYPAGPVIEEFAKKGNPLAYAFPLPMTTSGDFNLSFSGMKTFARNLIAKLTSDGRTLTKQEMYDFAASIQYAVFRHILYKLSKILIKYEVAEVWLGGGVAANMTLRKMIRLELKKHELYTKQKKKIIFRSPHTKRLCQDNAAMIGVAGGEKKAKEFFEREPNLKLI